MSKQDTSSPTAAMELIFIIILILQTKASDDTIIKLQGAIVTSLLKIIPEWEHYVIHDGYKKVPTIYSEALKVLYGTVDAAKLFNEDLSIFLIEMIWF